VAKSARQAKLEKLDPLANAAVQASPDARARTEPAAPLALEEEVAVGTARMESLAAMDSMVAQALLAPAATKAMTVLEDPKVYQALRATTGATEGLASAACQAFLEETAREADRVCVVTWVPPALLENAALEASSAFRERTVLQAPEAVLERLVPRAQLGLAVLRVLASGANAARRVPLDAPVFVALVAVVDAEVTAARTAKLEPRVRPVKSAPQARVDATALSAMLALPAVAVP